MIEKVFQGENQNCIRHKNSRMIMFSRIKVGKEFFWFDSIVAEAKKSAIVLTKNQKNKSKAELAKNYIFCLLAFENNYQIYATAKLWRLIGEEVQRTNVLGFPKERKTNGPLER